MFFLFIDLKEIPFLPLAANRTLLPSNVEDTVSGSIAIPGGLPFGNRNQTSAYVCNSSLNAHSPFYMNVV